MCTQIITVSIVHYLCMRARCLEISERFIIFSFAFSPCFIFFLYFSYFHFIFLDKAKKGKKIMLRLLRPASRTLAKDAALFLPEEHQMLRETLRNFADAELKPHAAGWDQRHEYPAEAVKKMGDLGIMGLVCPDDLGGTGMDYLAYAVAMEEISRGCATCGVLLSVNNSLWMAPMLKFGTKEQNEKFLPATIGGDHIGCFMLSEPGNGSDASAASTTAKKNADGDYVLNGTKNWITGSTVSRYGVVFATSDKSKKHKGIAC